MSNRDPFSPPLPSLRELLGGELKTFLLTFDASFGGRERLQSFLDAHPEYVKNWISQFDHAILIVSDRDVWDLGRWLHETYPGGSFFMITEVHISKINGWMPANVWEFIRTPRPGKRPEPRLGGGRLARALGQTSGGEKNRKT
jgi:hypothetical protein